MKQISVVYLAINLNNAQKIINERGSTSRGVFSQDNSYVYKTNVCTHPPSPVSTHTCCTVRSSVMSKEWFICIRQSLIILPTVCRNYYCSIVVADHCPWLITFGG